jgi:LPS sulfotransferase NodH
MIITILAEPRSGSTNLTNWFYFNKNFTTLFEPENPNSKWFKNNIDPKDYKYKTKHLCIKEVYYPTLNWNSLLNISDKIIVLYRENTQEQLESFLNAVNTNNWHLPYVYRTSENSITKEKTEYFKILKSEFKEKYVNKDFFTISYEELYYDNGFKKIVNYLNIEEVKNIGFPIGNKYRINKTKTLI